MKKRLFKKILLIVVGLIVIVLIAAVLFLGYLGFIPGVAALFGADKPRDLGVTYTQADYDSFMEKTKSTFVPLPVDTPAEESIIFSGAVDLKGALTQEEVSARIDYGRWEYVPITNVQIKFNNDGTLEVSGLLQMDNMYGFAAAAGYTRSDVDKAKSFLKLALTDPPVYAKCAATVVNNKIDVSVDKLEIGRYSVPLGQYNVESGLQSIAQHVIDDAISQDPKINIKSASLVGGKLNYEGTFADTTEAVE
jgi:hypothetical protein